MSQGLTVYQIQKGAFTDRVHVKYESPITPESKVIKQVKLGVQDHTVKNYTTFRKGVVAGNAHVKYESTKTSESKVRIVGQTWGSMSRGFKGVLDSKRCCHRQCTFKI